MTNIPELNKDFFLNWSLTNIIIPRVINFVHFLGEYVQGGDTDKN